MAIDTMLWRRLDTGGHDACRLVQGDDSWRLEGAATFRNQDVPACLAYAVECDCGWRLREGFVHGWVGASTLDFRIMRTPHGIWTLNGRIVPHLDGCIDLDFGFTPATNLIHIRRVALPVGQAVDVPVAWLDISAGTLNTLHQRYDRRAVEEYWYEAAEFDYFAQLKVNAVGFVVEYPGLWEAEL